MFDIFTEKFFVWLKQTREHCVFPENAFLERWPFRSIKKIHTKVSRSVDISFCLNSFGGKIPPQFSRFFLKKKNNYLQDAVPITARCFPQVVPIYQIIAKIRIVAWKVPFDALPYLKRDIKSI